MKRDYKDILKKHIRELFQILSQYDVTDKKSLVERAETDIVFQKAILMSVGYIGELSKKMDPADKPEDVGVNWRRLGTSRNIIFHEYDIVDIEIISTVVFRDIVALSKIIGA